MSPSVHSTLKASCREVVMLSPEALAPLSVAVLAGIAGGLALGAGLVIAVILLG